MRIRIFTTGGTIDKIYFDRLSEFAVGEPQIGDVLREANVAFDFRIDSLLRKDSLEMTGTDRELIRRAVAAAPERQILITHGTDTMIETALALENIGGKVIVLTGAMQPARLRQTDAVFNIGTAVAAVQLLSDGVWIVMNGRCYDPRRTRKNRSALQFEEI